MEEVAPEEEAVPEEAVDLAVDLLKVTSLLMVILKQVMAQTVGCFSRMVVLLK